MVTESVTVITGGGSGIGRATALRLSRRGDIVALCDVDGRGLEETAALVRDGGGRAVTAVLDVRDRPAAHRWCSEVAREFGKIDYLFSNAGVTARRPLTEMTLADWSFVIDVHVSGTFNFCQAALRAMVEQRKGAVVIMSSDYAVVGMRHAANYAAAKTALYSLAKTLAIEFAPHGIRVNAIGPGPIDTPHLRRGRTEAEWLALRRAHEERLPMRRLGRPEEVAAVVDFLLSERSAFITGQMVQPNGGQVMW